MKKLVISLSCLFVLATSCLADLPNEKVLKNFHTTFSKAQKVKWMEHKNYFDVSFVQSGILSNVRYEKDGTFLNCTRYYTEQQLPVNILCKLKDKYSDKKVFGVTEVTTQDNISYFVKMYDNKNWLGVKVSDDGQMEVVEKYKKA